jgi:prepilin-type processing-associated H-X9-DG protein
VQVRPSLEPSQCVILAGGLGTRMRPLTDRIPKALIPVCGVPFAHHQLAWLAASGVRRVVYSLGMMADLIRESVGDGSHWGLDMTYVDEGTTLRGTAGALRLALDVGALDSAFYVLYGDSFLPIEIATVAHAFRESGLPALMTVFRNAGQWDRSNVLYADGRVVLYDKASRDPRAAQMKFIDYGFSAFRRTVIEERVPAGTVADLAVLFEGLSREGQLAGYEVSARFYEVGSPEGLRDLEAYLANQGTPEDAG